ncbi:MAG: class I SAM-dependent methyltransferase [Caldicoprobacterales bacterium]|jgi:16S rRNA (guanine1207-N2)-methyltransferase|nr:class I SAM-dependent methyltransferase [Clostridiales bacterium]
MEHYFSENPKSEHRILNIKYNLEDLELNFTTDTGVFSKNKVDYGTDILIRTLPSLHGKVLDLGCGYGPIGISLAKLNPDAQITMVDINQRAVELSNQNIQQNNVQNAAVFQSDGFEKVEGLYNAIVSNPPIRAGKKVIYPLFERSIDFLEEGGALYLVIQKKQGAKSAMDKLIQIYGNCEVINKKGGYWILRSIKA